MTDTRPAPRRSTGLRRIALAILPVLPLTSCTSSELKEALGWEIYFVKLNVSGEQVQSAVDQVSEELNIEPIHIYDSVTEGFSVWLPPDLTDDLENIEVVESIEIDEGIDYTPPDAESGIVVGEGETPDGILRIGGPYTGSADLSSIAVAVVDTGVDSFHPDLNVVAEYDAVCESSDECADGTDPNGHGTHVAGTIGAIANSSGVVGVAPGVPIHAVRVLDSSGSGYLTDIIAGLEYVLDHPEIKVVNMSLGGAGSTGPSSFKSAVQAVEDAGVVVAIAAGNESSDTSGVVPAGYNYGIVVSAYDASGGDSGWAWFSNYGDAVDVAAPGVDILSTYPGDDYAYLDGTSMATPHVAGAAAVAMAIDSSLSPSEVRSAMTSSAESVTGQNSTHGEGLLDLDAFLDEISR